MKNGTKFTAIFALVVKVQTRTTLEQKMMPVRNKQFLTKTNMTLSKFAVLFKPFTIFLKNKLWTGNIFSLFFPK